MLHVSLMMMVALQTGASFGGRAAPRSAPRAHRTRVLRAQWNHSFRRHSTGHRMASGRHTQARVELRLLPGGRARVLDKGQSGHSGLTGFGYSGETTRWTHHWTGTWSQIGAGPKAELRLRLRLAKRRCVREKVVRPSSQPRSVKTRLRCPRARKRLRLSCRRAMVTVQPGATTTPGTKPGRVPAWRCHVRSGSSQTHGTHLPWVFGLRSVLKVIVAWPLTYVRAGPQPAP